MSPRPLLTLGPVLFNWPAATVRDFYARIADEAPVDLVHLGEIVCSKRAPFLDEVLPEAAERLAAAGKRVVFSTPILVTTERERAAVRALVESDGLEIEANDLGAVAQLAGRPHAVGPFVNVYNEATLRWLAGRGATAVSLSAELPRGSVAALAAEAGRLGVAVEVQVFGRAPLAISARCYHARAHRLHKDGCQFVCGQDADGLAVETLDGQPFLAVNGTQTLSHAYLGLAEEVPALLAAGVGRLRLSPHATDMVRVAEAFRDLLDGRRSGAAVAEEIAALVAPAPLSNGFFHDRPGAERLAGVPA
ncbi:ubiquinone anaerobic biosynthesis protein UbiV [Azospirillum sp. ST 5-10]|uniref:ubiquinone anaerobic biosynthesis protein UbiV n=1 Tax=unclassified Azospirillum TaxID=2630922 RepID=UPI003F49D739